MTNQTGVDAAATLAAEWQSLLREHGAVLDSLAEAGRAKRELLVGIDRPGVEGATRREEELLGSATELERRRRGLMTRTADILRIPAEGLTVGRIADRIGGDAGRALRTHREALREKGKALLRINRVNRMLTEQSLAHADEFLVLLSGGRPGETVYSRGGRERKPAAGSLVLDRVV